MPLAEHPDVNWELCSLRIAASKREVDALPSRLRAMDSRTIGNMRREGQRIFRRYFVDLRAHIAGIIEVVRHRVGDLIQAREGLNQSWLSSYTSR